MLVTTMRQIACDACAGDGNAFGPAFFEQHLAVVAGHAAALADALAADVEIVALAAWLHDIAAIRDFATLAEHHLAGAEIARTLPAEQNYPAERIERVADGIACHSSPVPLGGGTPEAVCLSNADAMAQITQPAYWLYYAFAVRRWDFEAGTQWYRQRVEDHWDRLIGPARERIAASYQRTQEILTAACKP